MSRCCFILVALLAFSGCQRAGRYPPPTAKSAKEKAEAKAVWGWAFPLQTPRDLPIRFVASDRPEWAALPAFWNLVPHPAAGSRTIHIGQSPLGIVAAFVMLDSIEAIAVKVPRGLPDPTPLIPECNPPTFGKWRLGKKIFFDRVLVAGATTLACADCHQPKHGFTEANSVSLDGTRNTLSLLNVAFNRSQFWDGRVRSLEEVLVHSIDDELDGGASRLKVLQSHRFGGTAQRLDKIWEYRDEFRLVFGVDRVNQDDVAKALATYLRTILSGDSLYDRAVADGKTTKFGQPTVEQFKAVLTDDAMRRLAPVAGTLGRDEIAERMVRGQAVFAGKGGCAVCHPTGLFTDHAYHNVLLDDSGVSQAVSGQETGRFNALPIGLKDPLMRGAYRTPSLRNLSATGPYFHNGSRSTISEAVNYFRQHLDMNQPLLAAPLRERLAATIPEIPGTSPYLFGSDEREAVILFLLSLDGQPVDPIVANR